MCDAAQEASKCKATDTANTAKTWPMGYSTETRASRPMCKTWPQWISETDVG